MRITFAPAAAVVLGACLAFTSRAGAQEPRRAADPVCFGFAFGAFTPKLDWAKAGHAPIRRGSTESAADGRDWASDQALPNDSSLYLFPAWWPVGIWVELAAPAPAAGDTVSGKATALVARGDITPPVAKVRAWRVPCARTTAAPTPVPAPDSSVQRARPHS